MAASVLERSRALAQAVNADVVVYRPVHDQLEELNRYIGFDNYAELRDKILAEDQSALADLLPEQELEAVLEWQIKPHLGIVGQVQRIAADIVVMAVSRHSTLGDLMLKPDDWHLLRECPCPVLLITREKHSIRSVVATLDCLKDSEERLALAGRILDRARSMADALSVPLHVLSVVPDPALVSSVLNDSPVMMRFREQAEAMARQRQELMLQRLGVKVEKTHLSFGRLDEVVQETVSAEELLVVGTRANRGLKGILLGNSAERLLHHLHQDMLVVT